MKIGTIRNWTVERFTSLQAGVKACRIEHDGCVAHIELRAAAIWVSYIETKPSHGHKGAASRLITMLIRHCARKDKTFVTSIYSNDGKRYLKPLIDRLCVQMNVRLSHTDA